MYDFRKNYDASEVRAKCVVRAGAEEKRTGFFCGRCVLLKKKSIFVARNNIKRLKMKLAHKDFEHSSLNVNKCKRGGKT